MLRWVSALLVGLFIVVGLWSVASKVRSSANGGRTQSSQDTLSDWVDAGPLGFDTDVISSARSPKVRSQPSQPEPGDIVEIELIETPEKRYAAKEFNEADRAYAAVINEMGAGDVVYDANLGHAARELAYQHSLAGHLVPHNVVEFLLRSAGAIDRTVTQGYTSTSGDGMLAVRKRLNNMLNGRKPGGVVRVGVGEAFIPGGSPSRYIAVLTSRRQVEIAPTPRAVQLGGNWTISGSLPMGYTDPSALALTVDGVMKDIPIKTQGRKFAVSAFAGNTKGVLTVSVSARGPYGSKPVLQLPVVVGGQVPTSTDVIVPPDESDITTPKEAAELAFELLNFDRERFGLPPLVREDALDLVAKGHSLDMRDNNFFGHVSPRTGGPGDRLKYAKYRATTYAENVAHGGAIHGAQQGLMKSLGHRRNILNPAFSHVGLGVAGRWEGKRIHWTLTQMFSRPTLAIDVQKETVRLRRHINAFRQRRGAQDLRADSQLSLIARDAAQQVAEGKSGDWPQWALNQAKTRGLVPRGAYISVQTISTMDEIKIPDDAAKSHFERLGVGLVQNQHDSRGRVGAVLLFSGGR